MKLKNRPYRFWYQTLEGKSIFHFSSTTLRLGERATATVALKTFARRAHLEHGSSSCDVKAGNVFRAMIWCHANFHTQVFPRQTFIYPWKFSLCYAPVNSLSASEWGDEVSGFQAVRRFPIVFYQVMALEALKNEIFLPNFTSSRLGKFTKIYF